MAADTDVHTSHCCARHGCKYDDDDCTVRAGTRTQEYPCEECDEELIESGGLELAYEMNALFEAGRRKTERDIESIIRRQLRLSGSDHTTTVSEIQDYLEEHGA
jgi:hypothetical protein